MPPPNYVVPNVTFAEPYAHFLYHNKVWLLLENTLLSGTALGVPLHDGENPHLKPATKPRHAKPNRAGA
jgi:hypothetical protein